MALENTVTYSSQNTYSSLNTLTTKTKNIWMVCHGIGYLSRYFIEFFKELDPTENYIIAPQAPSKYYQDKSFKYVGASWLTKENTALETENVLNYMNAVYEQAVQPHLSDDVNLIVFGFSQGVSVITRWIAKNKIKSKSIILHSGGIPNELKPEQFDYLDNDTAVKLIYGTQDHYLTEERMQGEKTKANSLFKNKIEYLVFDGGHDMNMAIGKSSIKSN